jgi:hypothetical protein
MLSAVYGNGDAEQPALTATDKACGRAPHFCPHHTEAKHQMMAPGARIVAEEFYRVHHKAFLAMKDSFVQQSTKFPCTDLCRSHIIPQRGAYNWNNLRCIWNFMFVNGKTVNGRWCLPLWTTTIYSRRKKINF